MNTMHYDGGFWPTRQQELLLRAALLQGKETVDAWHEWKSSVNVDQLDSGSQRLLPLLYRNLRTHGVKDSLMNKFKGIYQLTWYRNQMLFYNMAILLRRFHNAGIQTMILKGAALTLLYYRDYGLRPMKDFDVLIHTKQATAAINLLKKLGWSSKTISPEKLIYASNGDHFYDATAQEFNLHWYLLRECCYENADQEFWNGTVSTKLHDVSTHALCPNDQLLHACVHGARWNAVPPFRWIADAMMIIKTSQSEIDWNRLITHAQKRRLILPLKGTLNYLRDVLDVTVPLRILQSLQDMPVSKIERIECRAKTRSSVGLIKPFKSLLLIYLRYLRKVSSAALSHRLIGFPKYLQYLGGLDHLWQVPFYAVARGLRMSFEDDGV
jgi:hypothetical protein